MRSFRTLTLIVGLAACLVPLAAAQDAPVVTAPVDTAAAWKTDLVAKLAASQAGYQNWREGGINTVAFTVSVNGKAARTVGAWQQTYQGRLAFGQIKQDTLDFRKADDVIRLVASLQYNGRGFFATFNPTVAVEARSQFAAGFNFDEDPFGHGRRPPVKVSAFLSPGTFSQALGLTYDPVDWFTQRFGVGTKETVVLIERFRPLYGVDPDRSVRFQAGLEARTEIDRELVKNVRLQSTLGLFAAFNQPDTPDVLWENLILMQINEYLSVNFEFVTLFDKDLSDDAQFKEVLSLAVALTLL